MKDIIWLIYILHAILACIMGAKSLSGIALTESQITGSIAALHFAVALVAGYLVLRNRD